MPASNDHKDGATKAQEYQALVRKIADQVWELWRQDLRRDQERRSQTRGS